jgi:uncharacterized protein
MSQKNYREAIVEYIRGEARPMDKFSHQPRLYCLARTLAEANPCDDDVLFAAAWLHDLGVFLGHRPERVEELASWDNVAYAMHQAPELLRRFGFPQSKILPVVEAIRTHQPAAKPTSPEGIILREADILEQLGAVGILRIVAKIGRDTRYQTFRDALTTLRQNLESLPGQLTLSAARELAKPRVRLLKAFILGAELEGGTDGL